jgi:Tfp pilus assembly protein PilN
MIQFNLLPDVKVEYIKTQRLKRTVTGISLIASAAALFIFVFLILTVHVFQAKNMNDLSKDIKSNSEKLRQTPNLSKMLTVQSQLKSLTKLHDDKPAVSRLFGFMNQLTPTDASVSDLKLDLTAGTMTVSGDAASLDVVNKFVDSLKYATYKTIDDDTTNNAFSGVVLSSFARNEKNANYTIDMTVDTNIFDNASDVVLMVNNPVTLKSEL